LPEADNDNVIALIDKQQILSVRWGWGRQTVQALHSCLTSRKERKKKTLPTDDNDNIHSSQVVHSLGCDVFGFEDIFVVTDQTFIDFCHHSFWFEWFWINLIYKFEFFICVKKELNGSFYFFHILF
jgi:hypothetical protein